MTAMAPRTTARPPIALHPEERFLLQDVSWAAYLTLRELLDAQGSKVRLTYLEGDLELMTTSDDHEEIKKLLARLVEAYDEERGLDLNGFGSTTFRSEAKKRGAEPDECYAIGKLREAPDVVIEVVLSPPRVDKMRVYEGLGVREVWLYENRALAMFHLGGRGYRRIARSRIVKGLDAAWLTSWVRQGESQGELVRAFRRAVRARKR
jgi:Uma2 family endonuclease